MFDLVLSKSFAIYKQKKCCHQKELKCDCNACLTQGFFGDTEDYSCEKKAAYYVLKYGNVYISEVYHYLANSKILDDVSGKFKVLSLGCGFCPDYYAIAKYIFDRKLNIHLDYIGMDNSNAWVNTRKEYDNTHYITIDLSCSSNPFTFEGFDLIMMNKVFSTIKKHKTHETFMNNVINAVNSSMKAGAILVFNDVNQYKMGRDIFDSKISPLFNSIRRYYTDDPKYTGKGQWKRIPEVDVIYRQEPYRGIFPVDKLKQYVYFEYRK